MQPTNNLYEDTLDEHTADTEQQEESDDDNRPTVAQVVLLLVVLVILAALIVFVVLPTVDMWLNPPRELPPLAPPVQT